MSLTNQYKISWICKRCDFEMVEIEKDTIKKIVKILNPNFLSLPKNWKSMKTEWITVCPRCDNHSLGFETDHVFPIRTKSGDRTTINDLEIFSPEKITDWHGEDCKEYEPLALCPKCGIDSVIGSASGFPIEHTFLLKMREFWFSPSEWSKTMGASLE